MTAFNPADLANKIATELLIQFKEKNAFEHSETFSLINVCLSLANVQELDTDQKPELLSCISNDTWVKYVEIMSEPPLSGLVDFDDDDAILSDETEHEKYGFRVRMDWVSAKTYLSKILPE